MAVEPSADEVGKALEASMADIERLGPGAEEKHLDAFNAFMRGVTHASSARLASSGQQLLARLQPKALAWRFLVEIHERKRIQRRRVAATAALLLQVGPWLSALRADAELCAVLPQSFAELLEEHAGTECPCEEEPAEPPAEAELSVAAALLSEAKTDVAALDFCAADLDAAIAAFEKFRRAVIWAVQSPSVETESLLERLEPKIRILEFLTHFYERKRQYRGRVASALQRLLDLKSWRDAAFADKSLHAAVRDLMVEEAPRGDTFFGEGCSTDAVDLLSARDQALANGFAGVMYVRVIRAYDLVCPDGDEAAMSPFVRVALGHRFKRTAIEPGSPNPVWDAAPFLFQVPSMDMCVVVSVLDSDIVQDEELGVCRIYAADAPKEVDPPCDFNWRKGPRWKAARYPLHDVAHGEIELEVALLAACPPAASSRRLASPEFQWRPQQQSEGKPGSASSSKPQGHPESVPLAPGCMCTCAARVLSRMLPCGRRKGGSDELAQPLDLVQPLAA